MLTKRQISILKSLSDGRQKSEADLKSSFNFLQQMWAEGLIDGGFYGSTATTKDTRVWWILAKGREALAKPI